MSGTVVVYAVGDVCVNRERPDSIFAHVSSTINSADIAFCQLETVYSEKGTPAPQSRVPMKAHPKNAPAIRRAGFSIVSFATNHHLDWGVEAFLDTINIMRETGVQIIGVGKDLDEARHPAIIDCKKTKIAFLA